MIIMILVIMIHIVIIMIMMIINIINIICRFMLNFHRIGDDVAIIYNNTHVTIIKYIYIYINNTMMYIIIILIKELKFHSLSPLAWPGLTLHPNSQQQPRQWSDAPPGMHLPLRRCKLVWNIVM